MTAIISNNTKGVQAICVCLEVGVDGKKSVLEMVTLIPGNNSVKNNIVKLLSKRPDFQEKVSRGLFTIIMPEKKLSVDKNKSDDSEQGSKVGKYEDGGDEDIGDINSLKGYKFNKAIEIVEGTYDVETLKTWKMEETPARGQRSKVLKAIEEKIEELSKK